MYITEKQKQQIKFQKMKANKRFINNKHFANKQPTNHLTNGTFECCNLKLNTHARELSWGANGYIEIQPSLCVRVCYVCEHFSRARSHTHTHIIQYYFTCSQKPCQLQTSEINSWREYRQKLYDQNDKCTCENNRHILQTNEQIINK